MKKAISIFLFAAPLLTASATFAQSSNYDVGPVWRVSYYSIKPGQRGRVLEGFSREYKARVR